MGEGERAEASPHEGAAPGEASESGWGQEQPERRLNLICQVGDDLFAIAALDVLKVVDAGRLGRLPRLPAAVAGITHHRGRIVTVVELAPLVGVSTRGLQSDPRRQRVLIIDRGQRNVGLRVGAVLEIASTQSVDAPGARGSGRLVPYKDHAVTLLDTDVLWARLREIALGEEEAA